MSDNQKTNDNQGRNDSELIPPSCSVIRMRYLVDVQRLNGVWQNVESLRDEAQAMAKEHEWKVWLTENTKTWKDTRIVRETVVHEILPNAEARREA